MTEGYDLLNAFFEHSPLLMGTGILIDDETDILIPFQNKACKNFIQIEIPYKLCKR